MFLKSLGNVVTSATRDESGATLVEYGVALVLAIAVGGSGLILLGGEADENMRAAGSIEAFNVDLPS